MNTRITSVDTTWRLASSLSNARIQALENANKPPSSGPILQSVTYGSSSENKLLQTFLANNPQEIFNYKITPLSSNSTINYNFSLTSYYDSGSQAGDQITIYVNLTNSTCTTTTNLNQILVNLHSNSKIFPNTYPYQNTVLLSIKYQLFAGPTNGQDQNNILRLDNCDTVWSCTINEVQN